jgi:hypothetical protein
VHGKLETFKNKAKTHMSKDNNSDEIDLAVALERTRRDLLRSKDFEALKKIISPRIVYVHSTGGVDTFESYFKKLEDKTLVYVDVDYLDVTGTLFGSALILTGKMNAKLIIGTEQKTVQSLYMATWIKEPISGWVMCGHQGAPRL